LQYFDPILSQDHTEEEKLVICAGDYNICPRKHDDGSEYRGLVRMMSPLVDIFDENVPPTTRDGASYDHIFYYPKEKINIKDKNIFDWSGGQRFYHRVITCSLEIN